jgi:DNA repair protein RadC
MSSRKQCLKNLSDSYIASEISVQYKARFISENPIINDGDAYALFLAIWDKERINFQEQFVALFLNRRKKVIGYRLISTGKLESTTVDIRLIASLALHTLAASVIVAHNHPSGFLEASDADNAVTKKLKKALNLIDVKLLDHLIISEGGYLSIDPEELA